jgi:NADH-quinone oxidoreductase subunit N
VTPPKELVTALTGFFPYLIPEAVLGVAACVLFLGGTWRASRNLWGAVALLALALSGLALSLGGPTVEATQERLAELRKTNEDRGPPPGGEGADPTALDQRKLEAAIYSAPILPTRLALLFKVIALVGGAVLVLFTWNEMPADQAADYHACLLIIVAGLSLTGAANELVTLFLALELISIPTYVLLYLPRVDPAAQEAALKYFLLSIFSSALLLFGFSYLYGLTGTTNLPALVEALARPGGAPPAVALVALVMVVAGLGFRITAVPFHFYAPDVYQGTTTGVAALLAFLPKAAGFVALVRVLGFVTPGPDRAAHVLGEQVPVLLWIMAAVTMSLGNVLALWQDNVKRLLAYSSVAHAGYMLIGLAVAPRLGNDLGVESVLFYLVAYSAMTVGAFAVLRYLSTPERPVETVDDLAGLSRSHPGLALLMVLFLFSLIGIPLTAGFNGKMLVFFGALSVPAGQDGPAALLEQKRLFLTLALIGAVNAAVGAWYYLRIAAVMYLRDPIQPLPKTRAWPVLAAIWACALLTLGFGVYPAPLLKGVQAAVARPAEPTPVVALGEKP